MIITIKSATGRKQEKAVKSAKDRMQKKQAQKKVVNPEIYNLLCPEQESNLHSLARTRF